MPEHTLTYGSIIELAEVATRYKKDAIPIDVDFSGVSSWQEANDLAVNGWDTESAEAMRVAEDAISYATAEHNMPAFSTVWDVSGSEVDVARYLSSEPECMIDYELVPTPRNGRVIILCASVSISGAVSTTAIKRRGHVIAALAFALSRCGFAIELWADLSATGDNSKHTMQMRVLVKGANDELDPARIMFAFSHPAMLRVFGLAAMHDIPAEYHKALGVGDSYGKPKDPRQDLPEGTIYLPSVTRDRDIPDADTELKRHLTDLGIV